MRTNAFVLMTALPPTKGHLNLIQFAADLVQPLGGIAHVLVCTQPDEPFAIERYRAVRHAFKDNYGVKVHHLHRELEQNSKAPGFWEMWDEIMWSYGFKPGDFAVTSEPYGKTLADRLDGVFMPYDPNRELYYTKATQIRDNPAKYFHDIAHTFQHNLIQTVTLFGAESTGKTTISNKVSYEANGHWLFEYARPYLETAENVITRESMTAIWRGQAAIQRHGQRMLDKPWVVQDTDLFSTVGYWEFPHWQRELGPVPDGLIKDAIDLKSNLYLIPKSNIPFEKDPLRYGGDVREGSDEYWIDVAKRYALNYRIITEKDPQKRIAQALDYMAIHFDKRAARITYEREANGR